MSLRYAMLGSGSRGNAALVESGATCVLVDCGFSALETRRRLARLGKKPEDLAGILVTHEHGDHVGGVVPLARAYGLTVWSTAGTARQAGLASLGDSRWFDAHTPFAVGDLEVRPYPVPHDAREPAQFVFSDGARRLGMLTDVGRSTPHIEACLSGCDGLILECNHDRRMLAEGRYPPSLKHRVGGDHGHLNNEQAAALLGRLDTSRLQHVVAAHLSEKNNRPELARAALVGTLGCEPDWIAVAEQDAGLAWQTLS